jgi:hypothetical protein
MSHRHIGCILSGLALFTAGCHSIQWTDWRYTGITRDPMQETVRVESTPPGAVVYLGEQQVGTTPMTLSVTYSETVAVFDREQVERKGFEKTVLQTETERRDKTQNPTAVALRLARPRYRDSHTAFTVPPTRNVRVPLELVPTVEQMREVQEALPRTQQVMIKSVPVDGASVYLGDKLIGVTPFAHDFSYAETEIVFEKEVVRETGGAAPEVEVATRRQFGGRTEGVFNLVARREGYVDKLEVVRIPIAVTQGKVPEVMVALTPAPAIHDVDCAMRFTAREQHFGAIRKAIERFAVPREDGAPGIVTYPPGAPERVGGALDVFSQSYFIRVKDTEQFNALVADLKEQVRRKGFMLEIVNARVGAEFNTNAANAGIQHVLSGRVRPGSALYLVEPGQPPRVGEARPIDAIGSYSFSVLLPADVSTCYLVSIYVAPEPRYSPPLCVYIKVDVHTEQQVEIPQGDFEQGTRVQFTPELVQELAPRWPHVRLAAFDKLRDDLLKKIQAEEKDEAQRSWIGNIDRNMDALRRLAAEGNVNQEAFPFPQTRDWLNAELQRAAHNQRTGGAAP